MVYSTFKYQKTIKMNKMFQRNKHIYILVLKRKFAVSIIIIPITSYLQCFKKTSLHNMVNNNVTFAFVL